MNDAKEKAKELIEKFFSVNDDKKSKLGCNPFIDKDYAKQCALICVDEIIDAIDWHEFETPNNKIEYWQEVKEEIKKL